MNDEQISVRLAKRPVGVPRSNDWSIERTHRPEPPMGEALVRVAYISVDPAMRGWIEEKQSYLPPVAIGEVMRASAVGQVVASNCNGLEVGQWVTGLFGVQRYASVRPEAATVVDVTLAPPESYLASLGVPGLTAYFGLLDIGRPKSGETVLVSAASGAVGAVVGQIAKIKGCRVVGLASSDAKVDYLTRELGFDAAIKYDMSKISEQIQILCPEGVDVYFDNVGGDMLEAAIASMRPGGRIVSCGMISIYNDHTPRPGPKNLDRIIINRLTIQGFVVLDYFARQAEFAAEMGPWLQQGLIQSKIDVIEGVENFPEALPKLFNSSNFGKLVIKAN